MGRKASRVLGCEILIFLFRQVNSLSVEDIKEMNNEGACQRNEDNRWNPQTWNDKGCQAGAHCLAQLVGGAIEAEHEAGFIIGRDTDAGNHLNPCKPGSRLPENNQQDQENRLFGKDKNQHGKDRHEAAANQEGFFIADSIRKHTADMVACKTGNAKDNQEDTHQWDQTGGQFDEIGRLKGIEAAISKEKEKHGQENKLNIFDL